MGKNILILQTGGTVCSTAKNTQIALSASADTDLLSLYCQKYGNEDTFTVVSPLCMLSEDSTPERIGQLLTAVKQSVAGEWDGIIILHGTDTLPYSAAAVGLCFGGCGKCIVFASANITPDQPGSNALPNFRNAVLLVQNQIKGVFCTYQNSNGKDYVFLATRLNIADGYTDDFSDYFHQPFATVEGEEIILNTSCFLREKNQAMPQADYTFSNKILLLSPYPGLLYNSLNSDGFSAILHFTYHSATACTQEGYSLPDFVVKCSRKNLPVYLLTPKKMSKFYRTTQEILAAGAKSLPPMAPAAAYIKLLLAYNQNAVDAEDFLSKNYYFETVE